MDKTIFQVALIEFGTPEFDEALQLRNDILRKPLGMVFTPEDIALEFDQYHIGLYLTNWQLIACLTLQPLNIQEIKMRQVAVAEDWQGRGVGSKLVEAAEVLCREKHFSGIVLNARDTAVPFYQRIQYEIVGEPFIEVGIQHFKMRKSLK